LPQPGIAVYRLTQPLGPYEGFTIVLSFPKGLIAEPTSNERIGWFLADNRGVLIALIGFLALLWFCVHEWRRVGRDPEKRAIFARYEPPQDKTPAGLRYMRRMGYDMKCFSADVLALAVGGHLRINREDHFFKDAWTLDRNGQGSLPESAAQRALLSGLFKHGDQTLELKKTNAAIISSARSAHSEALDQEFQPRYFHRNLRSVVYAVLIALLTVGAAAAASGGFGIPAIVFVAGLMVIMLIVFGRLVRAPTLEGAISSRPRTGSRFTSASQSGRSWRRCPGPDKPPVLDAGDTKHCCPSRLRSTSRMHGQTNSRQAVGAAAAAEAASR
jgi:hypothetical protein